MKLILKNSQIVFKSKVIQELTPISVLKGYMQRSGFYKVGDGTTTYVNVYSVTAGTDYVIKTLPNGVEANPEADVKTVYIGFGTNIITEANEDQLSDYQVVGSYNLKNADFQGSNIQFTPTVNGYLYVSQLDSEQFSVKCLSSVYF